MQKTLLILLVIMSSIHCYSQISFEKGYYIDNSGQKIDCLIKNLDTRDNPVNFEYRLSENDEVKKININSVKEFSILNTSKYIRSTVKIDRSSKNIAKMLVGKNPIFKKEQLFLKVLVEGKANLYAYIDAEIERFFYNKDTSTINQLIYKKYKTSDNRVGKNNRFKQQLWIELRCTSAKMSTVEKLKYSKNSLIGYFKEYNQCNNVEFKTYEQKKKRDLFNLSIRPRINNSSFKIRDVSTSLIPFASRDADFGSKTGFGLGVEAEFILPFNKNKWAIAIEPTYQSFKNETVTDVDNVSGGKLITTIDYQSIELPISLRYYFFLNDTAKIFLNFSLIYDFNSKSLIEYKTVNDLSLRPLEVETGNNVAFGAGYKFKDKYSVEMRIQSSRDLIGSLIGIDSDYSTFSLIFGYTLF